MSDAAPFHCFATHWGERDAAAAMRTACRDLLQRSGQIAPPISLAPVWRQLGAHVRYDERVRDGSLDAAGDDFVVRVRVDLRRYRPQPGAVSLPVTWRRSRFTLAHELGHVLLLQGVPTAERLALADPALHDDVERLCNLAAAELLMPEWRFREDLGACGLKPAGLRRLYDDYLVSWPALMVRVAETCDANVTVWRSGVRPCDGELLRVTESYGSSQGPWLPRGLSERFLSQPLVRIALRDGIAACRNLVCDHRRELGPLPALASALPAGAPGQAALPTWRGASVPDEPHARRQVMAAVFAPGAHAEWERLSACRALDAGGSASVAAPFAMALDAA